MALYDDPILNSCLFTLSILTATFRYRSRRIKTTFSQVFGDDKVKLITSGSDLLFSAKILNQEGRFFGTPNQLAKVENELVYLAKCESESNLIQWTASGEIMKQNSTACN